MPTIIIISVALVIAALGWELLKRLASDRVQQFVDRRTPASRLVSRGEFIDGTRYIPVSLALSESRFYYENPNMQESLDLETIDKVDYDEAATTGRFLRDGRVLRLVCFGQEIRFLIPGASLKLWQAMLPVHQRPKRARRSLVEAHLVATDADLNRVDDESPARAGVMP